MRGGTVSEDMAVAAEQQLLGLSPAIDLENHRQVQLKQQWTPDSAQEIHTTAFLVLAAKRPRFSIKNISDMLENAATFHDFTEPQF